MASLIFQDAEKARDAICAENQKKIRQLYEDWAEEVGQRAKYYAGKTTASSYWQEQQMLELQRQLTEQSKVIANQIYTGTKESIYTVADSVVGCNAKFLADLGFPKDGLQVAFTNVPTQVVNNIVTGQIYEGGWNLSAAIWGDNEKTLSDIYSIVARGRAQNMTAYEISKALESYVSPNKAKQWNLTMPGGVKIYKRSVDYNAQRLVRTLTQHAYQQGVIQVAKANPFVQTIIWHANGSRVCELCMDRDGKEYKWNELPMDHPNGMCVMEPKIDMDSTVDQLADWFNAEDGTYPEIDAFAVQFGYVPGVSQLDPIQKKWLDAAGYTNGQMPKDFTEFAYKLTFGQQGELLEAAGYDWTDPHPFQKMEKYYNANVVKPGSSTSVKVSVGSVSGVESLGTSKSKTFNYWYTKLSEEQKLFAQQLKNNSGLTWQQWYEKNIYTGSGTPVATAAKKRAASSVLPRGKVMYDQQGRTIGSLSMDDIEALFGQQTESDMLKMEANAFARMTNAQSAGIRVYTGSAYDDMNSYLRKKAVGRNASLSEELKKSMQDAQAGLANASMERAIVVRRGTDLGDLAGFMPGDFRTNIRALESMTVDELNARFAGTTGRYAGFTSTSSLYDRGFSGDVEIIATLPKGAQASSVMSVSRYGTAEGETLLNSGTVVYIDRIEVSDGHKESSIRVFMDVIGVEN